ncbi:MAG TPA: hypothetical protein VK843_06600 [Planctomycetota bacterium]|nr:hypothetical protein [Planctomycetota bacterium]
MKLKLSQPILAASLSLFALSASSSAQSLTRIPALGGRQPMEYSNSFGISPGSTIFLTAADGLALGDANGQWDIVEYSFATGAHSIVVQGLGGASPNASTFGACVSSVGHVLLFNSAASNLVTGDTNGFDDAFLLNRSSGVISRASLGNGGVQGNDASYGGDVSDDGRFVVFGSNADNLVQGSASSVGQTFLRDTLLGTTELISSNPGGAPGNGPSGAVAVSENGRFVVFDSHATDLVPGDTNGFSDIFLRDRVTATTTRLNVGPGGVECDGMVTEIHVSADTSRIVFEGYATTLVPGTDGNNEVYLLDRPSGALSVISVGPGGLGVDSGGIEPRISHDGRWVAFDSSANLDPNLPTVGPGDDIFLYDVQTSTTRLISRTTGGNTGTLPPFTSAMIRPECVANGGSLLTFKSNRLGLVAGDTNPDDVDVFIWDGPSTCPPIESYCTGKLNSITCTPVMTSSGEPHVAGPTDAFFLATADFSTAQIGLILWSPTAAANPFSGGTLCLGSPIVRTPAQHSGGTGTAACSDGTFSFHFGHAYMNARGIPAGLTLHAQAYGRDSGLPPPFKTGLSNGIRFTTCP